MGDQWYYSQGGKKLGPVSVSELKELAVSGQLLPTDLVWKEGMAEWAPASSQKGFFDSLPPSPRIPRSTSKGPVSGRDGRDDYDDEDENGRSSRHGTTSGGAAALKAITATELGVSSTVLGGITLVGQTYTIFAAGMSAAMASRGNLGSGLGGAIFMLVIFILLSMFAGFLGLMGLITAIRKGQAGGTYCIVGMCVSVIAFITTITMMVALSGLAGQGR